MHSLRSLCATLLMAFVLTATAHAQYTSGNLVGTIFDTSGATVPNASVVATNIATSVTSATQSTSTGEYRISNLPIGTYNVTVTASGFTKAELANITVQLNATLTANATLSIGTSATTVDVTSTAATIDTTTAQLQTTFTAQQATELPSTSNGLGVLNLSLLAPGVGTSGTVGGSDGPSIGGQRPRNNNFTIEGVDNNNRSVTGPLVFVPNDDVAEFTLLQNQFSPEYGHSSAGQFNTIIKGGTNQFHGMLYDYNRNKNYNAIDNLQALQGVTSAPRYDDNRLGANFGGPILKNKLFFFAGYEYRPLGQSSTPGVTYSPTAAGYATLASIPGLSANNLAILKQYQTAAPVAAPAASLPNGAYPVVNGQPIESGILPVVAPNYQNHYAGVLSIDYNFSQKDQLRGRYIYNSVDEIDNLAVLPTFYTTLPYRYYLANISEYHNFSPTITNELRLGFNRYSNTTGVGPQKFPGLSGFPNLEVDELQMNVGPDSNAPQSTIINTYQLSNNLVWTKGAHTFKFGFSGERWISPQTFTQRVRGEYDWSTLEGYLTDTPPDSFGERSAGDFLYAANEWEFGFYGNDDWKITPNFTINLGLRYEYETVPTAETYQVLNAASNVPGLITFGKPKAQTDNFMPRIGFAYSPGTTGNTSVRGGFGIAYDSVFDNLGLLSLPPQLQQTNDVSNLTYAPGYQFLANGGLPSTTVSLDPATARQLTGGYIPNQKLPKSLNWNFGIQHVFASNYTFEARYVGNRGINLAIQDRLNVSSPVTPTQSLPTYLTAPSQATLDSLPYTLSQLQAIGHFVPAYAAAGFASNITAYEPYGSSTYHGLQTELTRRFSSGLQFSAAYTWSHSIDNSTAETFSTVTTPRRPQDFQNLSAERADSALDHRHRITLAAVYDLPFFKNRNWFAKNLIGNWEFAPIYTYQSGNWATAQSAIDSNLNGDSYTDRTVVNPAGVDGVGSGVTALKNSAGQTVAYQAVNSNARYIQAGPGVYPNGARNTVQLPPIDDIDMTLVKRFNITERYKFEFQAQALNLLNHPQYVGGYLNDITGVGYTGNDVRQFLNPASSTFNKPSTVFGSNPRSLILVAKFTF